MLLQNCKSDRQVEGYGSSFWIFLSIDEGLECAFVSACFPRWELMLSNSLFVDATTHSNFKCIFTQMDTIVTDN